MKGFATVTGRRPRSKRRDGAGADPEPGSHLPEKFLKSRENVEKRFRCSHCWASWGVLVGKRFCKAG